MTAPLYSNTVQMAIHFAYQDSGLLARGGTLSSEQYAEGLLRFNDMVNFLQTQGIKLWTQTDLPMTLTSGIFAYTLGPAALAGQGIQMSRPMRVPFAYYLDSSNNRVPMTMVSRQEWTILPSPGNSPGTPIQFFVDKQLTFFIVNLWPAPSAQAATGTVHLVVQQQIVNAQSLTDVTEFPPEWFLALRWQLAYDISSGQPKSVIEQCKANADRYMAALENWDVEDAGVYFTVDNTGMGYGNSFT